MRKLKLLFKIILFMVLCTSILFPSTSKAASSIGDAIKQAGNFIDEGKREYEAQNANETIDTTTLNESASDIFNLLFAVGTVIVVIVGGILGIQFMMASVEEKAKVKEMMIPYVIGSIAIFGAFGIWKVVVSIVQNVTM